jgi:hypothetical protein
MQLVVVASRDSSPEDAVASIAAATSSGGPRLCAIVVTGPGVTEADEATFAAAAAVPVRVVPLTAQGTLAAAAAGQEPAQVVVVRAGDRLRAGTLNTVRNEARVRSDQPLFGFRPTNDYDLDDRLEDVPTVLVARDPRLTWIGTAGFALPYQLLRECTVYDLAGAVGIGSLFLEALLRSGRARLVDGAVDCGPPLDNAMRNELITRDPQWYHGLNTYFRALRGIADSRAGVLPRYFQYAYVYLLLQRISANRNTADKMALRDDLEAFLDGVRQVLAAVSDDVLLDEVHAIDFNARLYLLDLKGSGKKREYRYYAGDIAIVLGDVPIVSAVDVRLDIESMHIVGNRLDISGRYRFPFDPVTTELEVVYDGQVFPTTATQRYTSSKAFGRTLFRSYSFDVSVPLAGGHTRALQFYLVCAEHGSRVLVDMRFTRSKARLTADKKMYWAQGRYLVYYRALRLVIGQNTPARQRGMERAYLRWLLFSGDKELRRLGVLRALYFLTRFYFRKRTIWIYFDKLYKGGDNGEYAYRHARTKRDGIDKYYVLQADCPDAARFKREGVKFVRYMSLWQRLLFLNADIVFTTHINPQNFGGFAGGTERFFRGLFRYRLICIQHGLSVQDLSNTLNRVHDSVDVFCLASPVERENLLLPEYDYRPEQLELTGLARYDGLESKDKRQILIAPTWRTYLAAPYNMGKSRAYSTAFRDSAYRQLYESLITDPGLIAAAAQYGYRIVMLLHPVTSSQLADFTASEHVDVIASTGEFSYEKALTESSLMVTDYSGVQFDFAYMYKPVVYFHPPELPASYEQGAYRYETMALGEICTRVSELVETLCRYMQRGCAIDDEYRARVDAFFAHHDHDNAERIYQVGRRVQAAGPKRQG